MQEVPELEHLDHDDAWRLGTPLVKLLSHASCHRHHLAG